MATNSEISSFSRIIQKEWKVVTATGTPTANTGEILIQTIQNNGGSAVVTWFNMSTSVVLTVAPAIANLFDRTLPFTENGRQEFSMWTDNGQTNTNQSIQTGIFRVRLGNNSTLTGQTYYTVPNGKRLRLTNFTAGMHNGISTTNLHCGSAMAYVAADTSTPSTSSPRVFCAYGKYDFNPSVSSATSLTAVGTATATEGVDLPAGTIIGIGTYYINISFTLIDAQLKGFLYNA
jgi:hypothetical protein